MPGNHVVKEMKNAGDGTLMKTVKKTVHSKFEFVFRCTLNSNSYGKALDKVLHLKYFDNFLKIVQFFSRPVSTSVGFSEI